MTWLYTPFALPLFAAAAGLPIIAYYAWRSRPAPGATPLTFIVAATAFWCATYALELLGGDLATKLLWAKVKYLGVVSFPITWLAFALEYTGRSEWLGRRTLLALSVVPTLTLILLATNASHHLIWTPAVLDSSGPVLVLGGGYGPAYVVHTAYSHVLFLVGTALLIPTILRASRLYRGQSLAMLVGLLAPGVANVTYLAGVSPVPGLDLTPYAFIVSALALAWGLLRFKLLDVVPIARDSLIEGMADMVIVLDANDRVVDLNAPVERVIGAPLSKIAGMQAARVFAEQASLVEHLRAGDDVDREVTLGEGTGAREMDLSISQLADPAGRPGGRLIVLRDITERRRAEETVRQYAARLEERNRELDAYSHTVAHDLKGPITTIAGSIRAVLSGSDGLAPRDRKLLAMGASSASRLSGIVDSLLLLATLRDQRELIAAIDVRPAVERAIDRVRARADERGMRIEIEGELPRVLGHGPWLEEVFANLLENAIKYASRKQPDPRAVVRGRRLHESHSVRLDVEDNGLGIPAGMREALFQSFARHHTESASGLGLGLSIVARIVGKLGGEVGVESEPGEGSTFWFTLPCPPS